MEKNVKFSLHPCQQEVWTDSSRFRVLVAGRRFGKTTLAAIELVISALGAKAVPGKKPPEFWYVAPSYRQAKMICWSLIKQLIPREMNVRYNEAELSVVFPNGVMIALKGADNENSLRGIGLSGCVIDEYACIYDNYSVLNEVIRPALADEKGWILFIGTPKGKDSFYDLYEKGQRGEEDHKSWKFTTLDNPFIDPEEVEHARRTTPSRMFRQEWMASFLRVL